MSIDTIPNMAYYKFTSENIQKLLPINGRIGDS